MRRNILYATVGGLAVIGAMLTYHVYQESREPTGIAITVGNSGVSIEKK